MLQIEQDFLEYLVKQGVLDAKHAQEIKLESVKTGQSIETILLNKGILSKRQYHKYRASFFGVKFIDSIYTIKIDEPSLKIIKTYIDKVKETKSFPFEYNPKLHTAKLILADFSNYNIIQFWRMVLKTNNIEIYTTVPEEIEAFIASKFGHLTSSSIVRDIAQSQATAPKEQETTDISTAAYSKVAKLLEEIISDAIKLEASDIHIEPLENRVRVRFRLDGLLQERLELSKSILPEFVTRVKILARLKIDETRLPQDGRILKVVDGKEYDLRISTMPTIYGEKVVMRILPREMKILSLEDLGLRGTALKNFRDALKYTAGIILITGPTGSGKTTTLATALRYLNKEEVNIVTIEDPVEIRQPGLTQIQVNERIGLTFAKILRSVLRQDPDIIMVGEIRDQETAELAIRAAMTGHLVLSTLHTNDAATAFSRLIDMGAEPYLVASTVKLVVSQRLVRTLCMYSRYKYIPPEDIRQFVLDNLKDIPNFDVFKYLEEIANDPERAKRSIEDPQYRLYPPVAPPFVDDKGQQQFYLYNAKKDERCNDRAYKGRIGIFEVLKVTQTIQEAILKGKSASEIEKIARSEGTLSFTQDGIIKALEGITTLDEVLRVAFV